MKATKAVSVLLLALICWDGQGAAGVDAESTTTATQTQSHTKTYGSYGSLTPRVPCQKYTDADSCWNSLDERSQDEADACVWDADGEACKRLFSSCFSVLVNKSDWCRDMCSQDGDAIAAQCDALCTGCDKNAYIVDKGINSTSDVEPTYHVVRHTLLGCDTGLGGCIAFTTRSDTGQQNRSYYSLAYCAGRCEATPGCVAFQYEKSGIECTGVRPDYGIALDLGSVSLVQFHGIPSPLLYYSKDPMAYDSYLSDRDALPYISLIAACEDKPTKTMQTDGKTCQSMKEEGVCEGFPVSYLPCVKTCGNCVSSATAISTDPTATSTPATSTTATALAKVVCTAILTRSGCHECMYGCCCGGGARTASASISTGNASATTSTSASTTITTSVSTSTTSTSIDLSGIHPATSAHHHRSDTTVLPAVTTTKDKTTTASRSTTHRPADTSATTRTKTLTTKTTTKATTNATTTTIITTTARRTTHSSTATYTSRTTASTTLTTSRLSYKTEMEIKDMYEFAAILICIAGLATGLVYIGRRKLRWLQTNKQKGKRLRSKKKRRRSDDAVSMTSFFAVESDSGSDIDLLGLYNSEDDEVADGCDSNPTMMDAPLALRSNIKPLVLRSNIGAPVDDPCMLELPSFSTTIVHTPTDILPISNEESHQANESPV